MSGRSGGIFLLPLLGVTVFALTTLEDRPWGQWLWAVDLMTGITVLSGPVLASCAAFLGWTQAQLDELVGTTPRRVWVPFRCAFQAWVWGVIAYAVSGLAIVVISLLHPHGGPFPLWAAAIGLPVLAVSALVGAGAVRLLPYRITVIAVGPSVFLAGAFGPSPYSDLLRHGPSTGSLSGLTFDPTVWMLQFAGLVAVAAALAGCLVVVAQGSWSNVLVVLPVGLTVLSLAALLACGNVLDDPGTKRLVVSDERPTYCRGSSPTICVSPSSVHALEIAAAPFRRAVRRLDSVGAQVPDRYEELLPGYRPPTSVGELDVGTEAGSLRIAARSAATPAGCPQWSDPGVVPERALLARELIVEWVRTREGEKFLGFDARGNDWLKRAASDEAGAWVRATFGQLRSCDFAAIRMPWAPPARG